ncbi:nucleotidyltransferase domain-containing protein [Streptomyces montanisoli]|uniref:Uncharacterized protein n=1 Tax=Streptomyces montanisoli TaxID=2798581 RepID=A0A940M936_9ACTN|nr:hypothetical protein [Streptomyces montanisoli]MBP0456176.1 hypothetical protein [Streptomyces montanisoli]
MSAADVLAGEQTRPHRDLSGPGGREIDLHPLDTSGTVAGAAVPCVSAAQQVYFHQGYEPADRDRHDMSLLRERFGVATPY